MRGGNLCIDIRLTYLMRHRVLPKACSPYSQRKIVNSCLLVWRLYEAPIVCLCCLLASVTYAFIFTVLLTRTPCFTVYTLVKQVSTRLKEHYGGLAQINPLKVSYVPFIEILCDIKNFDTSGKPSRSKDRDSDLCETYIFCSKPSRMFSLTIVSKIVITTNICTFALSKSQR